MSQETNKPAPTLIATRVDPAVAAQLAEIARQERRSVSAQLAIIVETYLAERTAKVS